MRCRTHLLHRQAHIKAMQGLVGSFQLSRWQALVRTVAHITALQSVCALLVSTHLCQTLRTGFEGLAHVAAVQRLACLVRTRCTVMRRFVSLQSTTQW